MFLSNKYSKYYFNIIDTAKARTLNDHTYVEKHHVVPRSLGGTNAPDNIVKLTAREHLICHRLLIRMTVGVQKSKMAFAAWRMIFSNKKHKRIKVTSRIYESIKLEMSKAASERSKTYRHSEESKQKIAQSKIGKARNVTWGDKIALANTGKKKSPLTEETKEKIRQGNLGKKHAPMTELGKKKLSSTKTGGKLHVDLVTGRRFYVYPTRQDYN